jgi:uncharacterized protein YecE (DUF72 family)
MKVYLGTMGFSYKDWVGVFYPEGLASRDYLSYYSRIFNAVEIDSTFYGTPKAETVTRWAAMTPPDFQFCLKTPRANTHDLGLGAAAGVMRDFVEVVGKLEDKLGVILLQFPPSFTVDRLADLDAFLAEAPAGPRYAVEVRHRSWYTASQSMAEMLSRHGVCWASTQYPSLPRRLNLTASYAYLRWIGQHGSYENHTHERIDRTGDLQGWLDLIQAAEPRLDALYGFMNNDYAGFGAGTANRFKQLAGLPVEPLTPPQQGRLL